MGFCQKFNVKELKPVKLSGSYLALHFSSLFDSYRRHSHVRGGPTLSNQVCIFSQ